MTLTRQHFVLIADTIRNLPGIHDDHQRFTIAESFANRLGQTNPNFDRDRFMLAAAGHKALRVDLNKPTINERNT